LDGGGGNLWGFVGTAKEELKKGPNATQNKGGDALWLQFVPQFPSPYTQPSLSPASPAHLILQHFEENKKTNIKASGVLGGAEMYANSPWSREI
jgi:hypothetical protein